MKISSIKFNHFRCFYGSQTLDFNQNNENQIALIHAENGVGKTTVLNALIWCFFGKTTDSFEDAENLINNTAKKKGVKSSSVEICFEHNSKHYRALRKFEDGKRTKPLAVFKIDKSGLEESLNNPESFIKTIIPYEMAEYFLFDGEHVEKFARAKGEYIRKAIKDILGSSLISELIKDLKDISDEYRKEIKRNTPNIDIQFLTEQILKIREEMDEKYESIERFKQNITTYKDQIEKIDQYLRAVEVTAALQKERDEAAAQIAIGKIKLKKVELKRYSWLGENFVNFCTKPLYDASLEFIDDQIQKGRVPEPYNKEFVQSIIDTKICICGRPLNQGSNELISIMKLLDAGSDALMRDKIAKARTLSGLLKDRAQSVNKKLRELDRERFNISQDIDHWEQKEKEISQKIIKEIKLEDVKQAERKRIELDSTISKSERSIGTLLTDLTSLERDLKERESELTAMAKKDPIITELNNKLKYVALLHSHISEKLKNEEEQALTIFNSFVNDIAGKIMRKNVNIKIDDNYTISMWDENDLRLPKSGGENQLLGMLFTIALIRFAKLRQGDKSNYLLSGTEAPLILDSPFGQLDPQYRRGAAAFLKDAHTQIVLLVSGSQASSEVREEIAPHLSTEYILLRHNTKNEEIKNDEYIFTTDGTKYKSIINNSEFDGTEILKIC